jgi:hypothetical protein
MHLPEPVFGLVLAYLTDGDPVPRMLRRSRPALVGEVRDWTEVRRLMDLKAHQLLQEARGEPVYKYRMMKVLLWVNDDDGMFAKVVAGVRSSVKPPLPQPPIICYHEQRIYSLVWRDVGGAFVDCRFERSITWSGIGMPRIHPFDAVFICKSRIPNDEEARGLHNGFDVFVV